MEGENVLHHVKWEEKLSERGSCPGGKNVRGIMSRGDIGIPSYAARYYVKL